MFKRILAAVCAAVFLLLALVTIATPAQAEDNYPAKPVMDAYMNYFASLGKSGAEQVCLSALYSSYYYAEYIWGPSVGMPSGAGGGLFGVYFNGQWGARCPGQGFSGSSYHYGITCASSPGYPCPEGPGPYISIGSTPGKNAFAGAEGQSASSTVYYVWAHETGHQWAYRSGSAAFHDECYADSFAAAMGARSYFGHCR